MRAQYRVRLIVAHRSDRTSAELTQPCADRGRKHVIMAPRFRHCIDCFCREGNYIGTRGIHIALHPVGAAHSVECVGDLPFHSRWAWTSVLR
jgi:hypothetical protein